MNELPKEYPFIHIYAQQKAHQPMIIKGNIEGFNQFAIRNSQFAIEKVRYVSFSA